MPPDKKMKAQHRITTDAAAAGILALLVDAREARIREDREAVKTEVLLADAGLSLNDISAATGKNYNAVRMTIQRHRRR